MLEKKTISVHMKGTAPLIVHKWSEKARQQMLDQQMGKAKARRSRKTPSPIESSYRLPDESYGFPATGFKSAIVGAARYRQHQWCSSCRRCGLGEDPTSWSK